MLKFHIYKEILAIGLSKLIYKLKKIGKKVVCKFLKIAKEKKISSQSTCIAECHNNGFSDIYQQKYFLKEKK